MVNGIIRHAGEIDIPQIVALERASTSAHWALTDYERLKLELHSGRRVALVAESEGRLVGFLIGQSVHTEWEVQNLIVAEWAKRLGIGSSLLEEFVANARGESAAIILLEVRESNSAARALYAKFGFEESGRRRAYYSNPNEDALVLRLGLQQEKGIMPSASNAQS